MYRKMPNEYYPRSTERTPDTLEPGPPVQRDIQYIQGWLSRIIGKYIKVEFLIGTSMLIDREGILTEVGVNYIVLKESGSNDDVLCDMYSIKFVRVYSDQEKSIICR